MDRSNYSLPQTEHLVPIPEGGWAFVPPPAPRELHLGTGTILKLGAADRAVGQLSGLGSWLPNPYLLIRPFLRREAVLSSRIEGTQASLSDLAVYEASPDEGLPPDVHEVANYVSALESALAPDRQLPVSLRLIRELHGTLMSGVRAHEMRPGEFRTVQNFIGTPGSGIALASYVPPPPAYLETCLSDFEAFIHDAERLPPLIRLAVSHYQFEAIHPFRDGNGRVGRLLVALLLVEERILTQPLLYLSAYLERRRDEYYRRLAGVSERGDWDGWIDFFIDGVTEQSIDAVTRARRLSELRDDFRSRLQSARASALPLSLVDGLFMSPVLTVVRAQRDLGVTYRAAKMNVDKLVDAGILVEMTERARNRLYFAPAVIELLQRDLAPLDTTPEQQRLPLE